MSLHRLALAAVVVLAVVAGGCGDDGTTGDGRTLGDASQTTDAAPATTATVAAPTTTTAPSTTSAATAAAPPSVDDVLTAGRPVNLAHAGGDQSQPHSTMFAFTEAVAQGADVLEMDVQLTADGVLIVQHDDTVDKTTNDTGPVIERTLEQIQALDNAYWFSPECWPCRDLPPESYPYRGVRTGEVPPPPGYGPEDFRVATFREVAEAFDDRVLDIEIKGSSEDGLIDPFAVADALAAELRDLDRTDSVVVVSFDSVVTQYFHEIAPEVEVSPGVDELTTWFLAGEPLADHYRIIQVPPFFEGIEVVTADAVARAHDEGLAVWVWPDDAATQENEAFYTRLVQLGVDGVIAGRPASMTSALAASGPADGAATTG